MSPTTPKRGLIVKMAAIAWLIIALANPVPAQTARPQIELWVKSERNPFATSIAFNPENKMYLLGLDGCIRQASEENRQQSVFTSTSLNIHSGGAGYMCRGMDCDQKGNVYLTDGTTIYLVDWHKKISRLMTGFQDAIDLKFDGSGNLYVVEAQESAVYRITPDLKKSRIISRGYKVRMREMLTSIAFDRRFENLYVADRYAGQILRYPIDTTGTAGTPEIVARNILTLRSIAVDDANNVYANIDYPVVLKVREKKSPKRIVIPNSFDFSMGRMIFGQTAEDRQNLYVPTRDGIVKISNPGGL